MKKLSVLFLVIACSLPVFSKGLPDLIPYRKDTLWGFCNKNKHMVVNLRYEDARPFINQRAAVKLHGFYFFINPKGERVSQFYEEVEDFQEECNVARVRKDNYWMLIDRFGNELIDPTFLYIREFNHNCAWAVDSSSRKWILINENGNTLNSCFYDCINDFEEKKTIAGIYEDGKTQYEILKNNGRIFRSLKNKYDFIDGYSNGQAVARMKDSTYSYLGKNNKIKNDIKLKNACRFSEGLAIVVLQDDRLVAVNKKMKTLFEIAYSIGYENCEFRCKLLPVCNAEGKWGLINNKGVIVLSTIFDNISECSFGIVAVKQGEKWAFWSDGKFLTSFKYDENRVANYWVSQDHGYSFERGLCRVLMNGKPGYLGLDMVQFWED